MTIDKIKSLSPNLASLMVNQTALKKLNSDYEVLTSIGKGGFGEVFKCRECISGHVVAIKRLTTTNIVHQKDILDEIKTLSSLNHHSIIKYHHTFVKDSRLHLVMEFCENGSLSQKLNSGKIMIDDASRMMISIMEAIQWVHSKGVVHHDIKPANLLLDDDNNVKIADFGVANTLGGTLIYMAPELLLNSNVSETDERTDIYSLGVTFIEMLTGRLPFLNIGQILMAHKIKDYGIQELPFWLQEFLYKAVNPMPNERYQTVSEMLRQFKQRNVPNVISGRIIEVGDAGTKLINQLNKGNIRVEGLVNYIENKLPSHPLTLKALGKFYLLKGNISKAEENFEQLFAKSQIISVHNDYARIFMLKKDYNRAIGLLSDRIQFQPDDIEAYSLLVECYFRAARYEVGLELLKILRIRFKKVNTFFFNYFLFKCVTYYEKGQIEKLRKEAKSNVFKDYNFEVFSTGLQKYCREKSQLSEKALFLNHVFDKFNKVNPFLTIKKGIEEFNFQNKYVILIGRLLAPDNDIILDGLNVSRRHCVIINVLNQVWIYDLGSISGTYVNGVRIIDRQLLYGKCDLVIGDHKIEIITDNRKLF